MTHSNPVMGMKSTLQALRMSKVPQFPLLALYSFIIMMSPENIILEQAMNILQELLCIWSDWKSLNGLNFLEDIYIKFRGHLNQIQRNELVEILELPRLWIHHLYGQDYWLLLQNNIPKYVFLLQIDHTLLSMFCTWFVTLWKSSFPWTPPLLRNYYLWTPPPPPQNFQLSYMVGVWIFSGTTIPVKTLTKDSIK